MAGVLRGYDVYKHTPLPPGKFIRVLTLQPSKDFESPIECLLSDSALSQGDEQSADPLSWIRGVADHYIRYYGEDGTIARYEAMSYAWGSNTRQHSIRCHGRILYVTQNCHDMLKYVRYRDRDRVLWVDAICIDQSPSSVIERNHQVALMGEVYKRATRVLAWLGIGNQQIWNGMHKIALLTEFEKVTEHLPVSQLRAVFEAKQRDISHSWDNTQIPMQWFERIWTIQEVTIPGEVVVLCGPASLPWRTFEKQTTRSDFVGTQILMLNNARVHRHGYSTVKSSSTKTWLCRGLVTICKQLAELRTATDPKDRAYGMHAILSAVGVSFPPPDYTLSLDVVFRDFTAAVIQATRWLAMINTVYASDGNMRSASWVPQLHLPAGDQYPRNFNVENDDRILFRSSFRLQAQEGELTLEGLVYAQIQTVVEPLSGWLSRYPQWSAQPRSRGLLVLQWFILLFSACARFSINGDGEGGTLAMLRAFCEDQTQAIERKWFLFDMINQTHDALVRVARIADDLLTAPYGDSLSKIFSNLASSEMNTFRLNILEYAIVNSGMARGLSEILYEAAHFCLNCTPFMTDNGLVGLGRGQFKVNDRLALFYGSLYPVVIRNTETSNHYHWIGSARVEGFQDGIWPLTGEEDEDQISLITLV